MGRYIKRFLLCFFFLEVFGIIVIRGVVFGLRYLGVAQPYDFFATHPWANRSLFYVFLALATIISIIHILRHHRR
ncbi:MAG: hypothetical protein IKH26_11005 [Bacteroidaceae bacterium]|nr:hypothetical protein [Bacteroidaceae bacterium]